MKMSWLLGSEWNKVRCPGVFKEIVKWLKVVCGLEICVCVHLTKENKFLPQKNGCHLNALGKHKHDLLPSCWLFWLNGRWYRSTKPKPKAKQVVEYSEISKETSELMEGGRSDNSIHSTERKQREKKQLSCQNFRLVYRFSKHICRLVYRAGNICNHFFTRDFLQVKITQNTKTQNKQVSYERKYLIRER